MYLMSFPFLRWGKGPGTIRWKLQLSVDMEEVTWSIEMQP